MLMMIKIRELIKVSKSNDEGMGVVEVAVIIVILLGLAIIFKNTISDVLDEILGAIKIDEIINGK